MAINLKQAGIDDFKGTKFHPARWNQAHELTGERIGVVGIAPKAKQLHLYQRTANGVVPNGNEAYTTEQLEHFRAHPEAVQANRDQIYSVWNTLATFSDKKVMARYNDQLQQDVKQIDVWQAACYPRLMRQARTRWP